MPAPAAAVLHYEEQARISAAAIRAALQIWATVDPMNVSGSWVADRVAERMFLTMAQYQELAAMSAEDFTTAVLIEQGIEVAPDATLRPASFAGVASDGRDLDGLLLQPVITAATARARGMSATDAMLSGVNALARIYGTQVQDAGRSATSVAVAARPRVGYVRLVEPKACSRCVVLAGRFYRYSSGFARHPLCKCRNIPASEDTEQLTAESDPKTHFNSLSETEQNRQFTVAGAKAIREGADISQVVNARRGALGLDIPGRLTAAERAAGQRAGDKYRSLERTDVYGRPTAITTEGITARGTSGKALIAAAGSLVERTGETATRISSRGAVTREIARTRSKIPRLMPEAIFEIAKDREDAIRLLRRFGYFA